MVGKADDPAADPRADYDYRGPEAAPSPALEALEAVVDGEVRFDHYSRELYATDASIYEVTPLAVVFPRSGADVSAVMTHCWEHEIPVLPRGAGTSLAGQTVNEAVVLDFTRHLDRLEAIDPEARRCVVESGMILGELNEALAEHGLKFAPDPAWADKSTVGGAIGNNSTGAHSLQYGKTDAYIESCDVVLADGTRTSFGWTTPEEIAGRADPDGDLEGRIYATLDRLIEDEADTISAAFPALERNVSGYNLDRLVEEASTGEVNVARVLAGSEGTLATVTAAELALESVPAATGVGLLLYEDVLDAVGDVESILSFDPAAVELVDDVLLDLARETAEFGPIVETLPESTDAVLLVECYGESSTAAREAIEDLIADRDPATGATDGGPAIGSRIATTEEQADRFWKLRKSGLPILLSRTGDDKHIAFIEDTAVPADALVEYVADVQAVLEDNDTFASFYAHAGPGCLHIRPLVNTKTADGVDSMVDIADRVTDLVVEYDGGISGEHGDGRARTQWNSKQYGPAVMDLFRDLKTAFDPRGLLNPGQVCGEVAMTENLRFGPDYTFDSAIEPTLHWHRENGFQGMVELCHGCGGCRGTQSTTGGTMCPTYRAADEEITTTRGRANLLRQAMNGTLPPDAVSDDEFVREVLDLCIGCKGCARDCPSEVDMAKLKAELTHAYQQNHGIDRRTALFSNIHRLSAIGSHTAPLSNLALRVPGAGWLGEQLFGIARERQLPEFAGTTFLEAHRDRRLSRVPDPDVVLLPDVMTNYHDPQIATAAVSLLEGAGVRVAVPDAFLPSGRTAYSLGRLGVARERARTVLDTLWPAVETGATVVTPEPSDAVMLQSDYHSLLGTEEPGALPGAARSVAEFVLEADLPVPDVGDGRQVTYHGHCHQKAAGRAQPTARMLERAGYAVDVLDSGCCGMAGAFGYEAEHYSMSVAIGDILRGQIGDSGGTIVAAPGGSCRAQLDHLVSTPVAHPIELLSA